MQVRSEASVASPGPRPPRILVVDDDPAMRALCSALLEREGFEVVEAEDGRQALARAVSEPPDLVLCDISMPVLDGFGVAAALRENERTRHVPIVFLSGETEPEVEAHAYDAGAHGFFKKPFAADALVSIIRNALARRARSPAVAIGSQAAS